MLPGIKLKPFKYIFICSFLLVVGVSSHGASQTFKPLLSKEVIDYSTDLGKKSYESGLAYELLESLTTEVGARAVGTPGDAKGVKWSVAKMKTLGFDKVWTEDVVVPGWQRGTIHAEVISPYPHKIVALALGGAKATPDGGITAPLAHFKTYADLQNAPNGSLKGKIAFVSNRMEPSNDGSTYLAAYPQRGYSAATAAEKGALAVIIRSLGTSNNRIAHTGGGGNPAIPAASISNPDADLIVNMLKRRQEVKFHLEMNPRRTDDVITANVIGEITGTKTPEDFIILAAHLDSWDVGTGAIDDGMGVGITLAAAKEIIDGGKRPERSIRVILFGAEEVGLHGARQYLENHKDELDHHLIGNEWDAGTGTIYALNPGVGANALNAMREMAQILTPYGVSITHTNNEKGQSDLSILGQAGMPAISFKAGAIDYFDFHHTENDVLANVQMEPMRQGSAIYTIFAWITANTEIDFRK